MKTQPLVSVVTCTYNRAHLIGETIRSVLSQTWQNLEYVIVDDGSTDGTEEIVKAFADARIRYYFHERTGGHLSRLRNFAHRYCKGEFIAYVDSDDLWEAEKLELQLAGLMREPHPAFSFTDISIFDQKGIIKASIYNKTGTFTGSVFEDMLANKLIICHTTLIVKTSCFEKTGPMDEEMHSGDHDLVFFLSRHFDAFVIYRPLVRVRKHDQNSTSSNELSVRLLREHHRTLEKLRRASLISGKEYHSSLAITSYSFGHQMMAAREISEARNYFRKSWSLRPWHLKSGIKLMQTSAIKIFS